MVAQAAFPDAQGGGGVGAAAAFDVQQLQAALPPSSILIHLVVVSSLNTRRPFASPCYGSETSHFSCVGKQKGGVMRDVHRVTGDA